METGLLDMFSYIKFTSPPFHFVQMQATFLFASPTFKRDLGYDPNSLHGAPLLSVSPLFCFCFFLFIQPTLNVRKTEQRGK